MNTPSADIFKPYMDEESFAKLRNFDSLSDMWQYCVSEYADRVAIVDEGVEYTFARLEQDAARLRGALSAKAGDRVGILAANSYDFVKAVIAVTTVGCAAVILPAQLDAGTVFGCSFKFGFSELVYQAALDERTAVLREKRPDVRLVSADTQGESPVPAAKVSGDAPCVIMFTGGTTGKSKGALLSNRAVMQGVINSCYGLKEVFFQRYVLALPLSHVFGLIRNLLASLYTGSALWICRNNKDMFRDIAVFRPTIMVMVPALAEMALTLSKKFGRNMLGDSLRCIICGAAPVSPFLIKEYDRLGIKLLAGYGLTESANLVSGNPESLAKPESVGIPFPNQEFRISPQGELWLKGKNMMDGYVGIEEPDAYEDGWFKTGDLVRLDEDGFLYITGRIKEIIVLPSGENVSPAEVEVFFNEPPFIQDSQVFEDENESGQRILALEVVPRLTELRDIPEEQRKNYIVAELQKINEKLPPFQRVSRITVRDTDFERTPAMKIVRYRKFR